MNDPSTFPDEAYPSRHNTRRGVSDGRGNDAYKKITSEGVRVEKKGVGKDMPWCRASVRGSPRLPAFGDINRYLARATEQRRYPRPARPNQTVALDLGERHRGGRAADVPGHRHGHHHGKEGLQRHHRRRGRGRRCQKARATRPRRTRVTRRRRRSRRMRKKITARRRSARSTPKATTPTVDVHGQAGGPPTRVSVPGDAVGAGPRPLRRPEGEGASAPSVPLIIW